MKKLCSINKLYRFITLSLFKTNYVISNYVISNSFSHVIKIDVRCYGVQYFFSLFMMGMTQKSSLVVGELILLPSCVVVDFSLSVGRWVSAPFLNQPPFLATHPFLRNLYPPALRYIFFKC